MIDNIMTKYIFFWGHRPAPLDVHVFSQWYPSKFMDSDGREYNCCEQYMMYKKALLFGDNDTAKQILATTNPQQIKQLGRQVKHFDENVWNEVKFDIVVEGNTYKFSQNENLKKILMKTNKKIIVEASPYDAIWGIGFAEKDAIKNEHKWGENLLGKAIMKVRDGLFS